MSDSIINIKSLDEIPRHFTGKILWKNGSIWYYKDDMFHCDFGPAIIIKDSMIGKMNVYYLNGTRLSKEEWFERLNLEQKMNYLFNLTEF